MQCFSILLSIFMIYIRCTHQADVQDIEECGEEVGLSYEKLKEVGHKKELTTHSEKCFMACVYKKIGRMIDGKFNVNLPNLNPNKLMKMQACADEANRQSEECEVASVATTCLKTKALS